ncbi:hypothetical protein H4582DRAFT_2053610 [Lactarius indigo]|nr:hypothetical protein H4582DRAFT_2053610 [Lactarius indigo]
MDLHRQSASVFSFTQLASAAIFFEEAGPLLLEQYDNALIRHQDDDNTGSPPERTDSRIEENALKPQLLRALLRRLVLTSVANYASLALLDITAGALMPFAWSTPIALGRLDLTLASIGLWLSTYGCVSALFVFPFAFLPRLIARFGSARVVVTGAAVFAAIYVLFPFEDALARGGSATAVVCPYCQAFFRGADKRSLGATNGPAQTVVSIQRAVGPAVAVSLFAFSLQNKVLGVALCLAIQLPRDTWKHALGE